MGEHNQQANVRDGRDRHERTRRASPNESERPERRQTYHNVPDDALVEVPYPANRTGVRPYTIGYLLSQLAALNRSNVNGQSLAVEAVLERDEKRLR
ncbi:family 4 glycosyl hydrolase [Halostagnicola kamekurae]|uniref:family 4 glycosyl hydrolase n=1 Tax=Halostagnicola kamekurae TaxID=619731 RepID=UPI00373FD36C